MEKKRCKMTTILKKCHQERLMNNYLGKRMRKKNRRDNGNKLTDSGKETNKDHMKKIIMKKKVNMKVKC